MTFCSRHELRSGGYKLHPFTSLALDMVSHTCNTPVRSYHLYTDGTHHSDKRGGAAVVAIAVHKCGTITFIGAMACSFKHDHDLIAQNGPTSNNVAEILAVTWASVIACKLPQEHTHVVVHPDSTCAMYAAQQGALAETNQLIARVASGVFHYATQLTTITMQHVPAHTGNPWNELADTLANHAAREDLCPPWDNLKTVLCLEHGDTVTCGPTPWLFLKSASPEVSSAYPSITGNIMNVSFSRSMPVPNYMMFPVECDVPKRRDAKKPCNIKVATVNVLTLQYSRKNKECAVGLRAPKRLSLIQKQFQEHGVAIVAVQ